MCPPQALRAHEHSLRSLFLKVRDDDGEADARRLLMGLGEWLGLVRGARLLGADLSERDACLSFAWSRMCVVDMTSSQGRARDGALPFEGFLEALCHVSVLKALPSRAMLRAAVHTPAGGCTVAGFLDRLSTEEEEALMAERTTPWGEPPPMPVSESVGLLIELLMQRLAGSELGKHVASLGDDRQTSHTAGASVRRADHEKWTLTSPASTTPQTCSPPSRSREPGGLT